MDSIECFQDVVRLSSRQLNDLAVSKDLLRLARKVHVMEFNEDAESKEGSQVIGQIEGGLEDGEDFNPSLGSYRSDESFVVKFPDEESLASDQKDILFTLLHTLSQELLNKPLCKEKFDEEINLNDHQTLTDYLINTFGEECIIVRLLKSCHQTIIAKLLHNLRAQNLTFKDVRNSWRIQIRFSRDSNGAITTVSTLHRRKEQIYIREGFVNLFQFEWEVESYYSMEDCSIQVVALRLLDIDCNADEYRTIKEDLLKSFSVPVERKFSSWCVLL